MGYVDPLEMAGEGGSSGRLRAERKCWNKFKLISGYASGGAESGTVS